MRARHNGLEHLVDTRGLDVLPSELFSEHIFACLLDEPFGSSVLQDIPLDNVMVEVDYPHADSTWPGNPQLIGRQLADLSPSQHYQVMEGNARRVFHFDPDVERVNLDQEAVAEQGTGRTI